MTTGAGVTWRTGGKTPPGRRLTVVTGSIGAPSPSETPVVGTNGKRLKQNLEAALIEAGEDGRSRRRMVVGDVVGGGRVLRAWRLEM
jgi:hypothetical protein